MLHRLSNTFTDANSVDLFSTSVRAEGHLSLRNVDKTFQLDGQTVTALSAINLDVAPGEFVALVGPSGCGKSTILRLVAGLERPSAGEIKLDGKPIVGPGTERGIVFQEHSLFPWKTVEQNIGLVLDTIKLARKEKKQLVDEHIALVGLSEFANAYPHQLSGGMAQRAAIARGLVARPRTLLLDEPLGALDSLTRTYLQQELLRIWRQENITTVLVTHDVEEAVYLADRIVIMHPRPGRIRRIVSVDLSHPRKRGSAGFASLKDTVLSELGS